MADLRELYQEVIVDHNRRPRNFGRLAGANRTAEGFNPLCGDRLTLYLNVQNGVIEDLRFDGAGCAISTASASLMTETLKGKTEAQAQGLFDHFRALVTGDPSAARQDPAQAPRELPPKLLVLEKVREFPARVKCATLCWHTLHAALANEAQPVSTE